MKPAPFRLHRPRTLPEALDLLATLDNAKPLAGGQSLVPMLNFRFLQPDHLVDLNCVAALDGIVTDATGARIGAMVRQRMLAGHPDLAVSLPILRAALAHVGHRQTRARGTIGGSLCHFDPSAELANLACLLGAQLVLARAGAERRVAFAEFGRGYMETAVASGEVLREIHLPIPPPGHGWGFEEFAQRHGDYALAMASAIVVTDARGTIRRLAVAVSGLSPVPRRLAAVEAGLVGVPADDNAARAIAAAAASLPAMDDAYVSGDYRRHLAGTMALRAARTAFDRTRITARMAA